MRGASSPEGVEVGTTTRGSVADMPYKADVRRIVHDLFARGLLVLALGFGGWPAASRAADEPAPVTIRLPSGSSLP